jgi:DNA-binding transcriptional ArsR family regulator
MVTVRLQLNADDLAKVRVSASWGPFNEGLLSLKHLHDARPSILVEGWRRVARGHLGEWIAPLLALTPRHALVDLHTVVGETSSIEHAVERLEAAPGDHLSDELTCLGPWMDSCGSWARLWRHDLADGNRHARRELAGLIWRYHESAIEPSWSRIAAHLEAERARCGRIMATRGAGELLNSLHPKVRWQPPFLEVNETPGDSNGRVDVLGGRSLFLVPSVFCLERPWILWNIRDESSPKLLVYPVLRGLDDAAALWADGAAPGQNALARLLGSTRAGALDAVADVCTTTELARRLGVSPATASHHAGVLREARLIRTSREGNAVRHRLTDLGTALLNGRRLAP